jgi:hypothetical protein
MVARPGVDRDQGVFVGRPPRIYAAGTSSPELQAVAAWDKDPEATKRHTKQPRTGSKYNGIYCLLHRRMAQTIGNPHPNISAYFAYMHLSTSINLRHNTLGALTRVSPAPAPSPLRRPFAACRTIGILPDTHRSQQETQEPQPYQTKYIHGTQTRPQFKGELVSSHKEP